ncbi:multiheme c-type cytochrome [Tautonia sociabilis]|nr:multiheme c-type cytochrome [Tautonia sociabilis]
MSDPRSNRPSAFVILAASALLGLAGLGLWMTMTPPPGEEADDTGQVVLSGGPTRAEFAGADACIDCHPGAHASFTGSGHARTIRPAGQRRLARELDGRTLADPERSEVTWTYLLQDGLLFADRAEGGRRERIPLDFALGSGHHATTFVTVTNADPAHPTALEHRLTHFADGTFSVTPGQRAGDGLGRGGRLGHEMDSEEMHKCFGCHSTLTSATGSHVLDVASMIPNVSCERCHGPARAHVEARRRAEEGPALRFGLERWTVEEQLELCGTCHRHPSNAPPGIIRPDNVQLARFQPVGLMQSPCFTEGDGTLSCLTCHDPHARARSSPIFYEAICASCHGSNPTPPPTPGPPAGCLDCHMPKVDSGQGVRFTDHWIRIRDLDGRTGPCTRPSPEAAAE